MYVHTHVHICVCVYTCMYIRTYTRTLHLDLARLIIIKFETTLPLLWVHVYISIINCAIAFMAVCLKIIYK